MRKPGGVGSRAQSRFNASNAKSNNTAANEKERSDGLEVSRQDVVRVQERKKTEHAISKVIRRHHWSTHEA